MPTAVPRGIVVINFGGQYCQLIARRVREARVYCEVLPYSATPEEVRARNPVGLILSGSPASVLAADAPAADPALLDLDVPVLGICYGMQWIAHQLGGAVGAAPQREYGRVEVALDTDSALFQGMEPRRACWMSHTYQVMGLPEGFTAAARSANCPTAAFEDAARGRYGVQFHPEVTHTEQGGQVLSNF
jgi:GMP synthase (glutamine-hydrolysing)